MFPHTAFRQLDIQAVMAKLCPGGIDVHPRNRKAAEKKQRQGIEDAGVRGNKFGKTVTSRHKDFVLCVLAYERDEIISTEAWKRLVSVRPRSLTG